MLKVTSILATSVVVLSCATLVSVRAYFGCERRLDQVDRFYQARLKLVSEQLLKAASLAQASSSYCKDLFQDPTEGYSADEASQASEHYAILAGGFGSLSQFVLDTPNAKTLITSYEKYDSSPSVRIGATCSDGWRSSAVSRGACSHHGGVGEWLLGKTVSAPSASDNYPMESLPSPNSLAEIRSRFMGQGNVTALPSDEPVESPDSGPANDIVNRPPDVAPKTVVTQRPRSVSPATKSGYFFLGSTESDVLKVMGTPTGRRLFGAKIILSYELSDVSIVDGVVSEYSNTSKNLRTSAPHELSHANSYFFVGSTVDEVFRVMGTPSGIRIFGNRTILNYDLSDVSIVNAIVTEYANTSNNLRIK